MAEWRGFDRLGIPPRWRKVARDLWLHRSRTLLVVAAVAIGLIGAGSILNAWALVRSATAEGYQASLPVSATLTVDRVDAALLQRVRALPEIAAARGRRTVYAAAQSAGSWLPAVLFAVDDFDDPGMARLRPAAGAWPPDDGYIVIERSSLELSGATLGEGLQLKVGTREPKALVVSGIVRDVSLAPGWMEHVVYAYATPATLAQLGADPAFNELQLRVRDATADRDTVRRIAYAVKGLIETNGGKVADVDVPVPGQHIHAAQMDSLLLTQGAFGLLSLLVCALLIVNLIAALLTGQAREIGVMKTLGAGTAQIVILYLGLALLLGLLASLIAIPVALLIGRQYAGFKAEMLNFPLDGYAIPWWSIALQLGVGCLLPVAAAALPVLRSCRMSVGAALRDIGIVADGGGLHSSRRIAVGGLSRPLLLAIGNAFRRRQRMLLTLLALAVGGAVFLGAQNLRSSVRGSIDLLFSSQRFDLVLRFAEPHPAAAIEAAIGAIEGVERAEAWRGTRAAVAHPDGTLSDHFTLTALPPQSSMLRAPIDSGRWLQAGDGDVLVVSRRLFRDESTLQPGAKVDLVIDGTPHTWTVVGVVDGGPQSVAYAPRSAIDALRGNAEATTAVVALSIHGAGAQLEAIARLRTALAEAGMAVAGSQRVGENRRVLEDHLSMVVEFLAAMGWVMIAVGGMGLASTMSLAVLERTREIGVLRAIGARHGAILLMVQVEGLVIAILSWLLALPLSVPMSVVLSEAFGRVMFSVPITWLPDADGALRWLLVVVLVSLLACAWPARRATRVPTAAALSYE